MKVEWLLKVVEDQFVIRKQKNCQKEIFFALKWSMAFQTVMLGKKNPCVFLHFNNWTERWDALISQKLPLDITGINWNTCSM